MDKQKVGHTQQGYFKPQTDDTCHITKVLNGIELLGCSDFDHLSDLPSSCSSIAGLGKAGCYILDHLLQSTEICQGLPLEYVNSSLVSWMYNSIVLSQVTFQLMNIRNKNSS
uniref:Uncharacterized protein n=1 Tax=Tetranychus urticae TaxID=32264 RepID=T1KDY9_TETUR